MKLYHKGITMISHNKASPYTFLRHAIHYNTYSLHFKFSAPVMF